MARPSRKTSHETGEARKGQESGAGNLTNQGQGGHPKGYPPFVFLPRPANNFTPQRTPKTASAQKCLDARLPVVAGYRAEEPLKVPGCECAWGWRL